MSVIPKGFICPISQSLMDDPYIDPDGNSYERNVIMEWLEHNTSSPMTRNPLTMSQLVPNRDLRSAIEDFRAQNPKVIEEFFGSPVIRKIIGATHELNRKPCLLFAIIDNSGSMQLSCGGQTLEDDGYSRLDLVKHTLSTIISSLSVYDEISIIKFSTVASIFIPLTNLSDVNKPRLIRKLDELQPENQTNIWDGLRLTADELSNLPNHVSNETHNIQIFLLTDGEPNINPPRPIPVTLQTYLKKKLADKNTKPIISTFGYGNSLDSSLLYEISHGHDGFFGFIPDATMVGTVFINAMSNVLSSMLDTTPTPSTTTTIVTMEESALMTRICEKLCAMLVIILDTNGEPNHDENAIQLAEFTTWLYEEQKNVGVIHDSFQQCKSLVANMLIDIEESTDASKGQIHKAIQSSYFNTWGKHYLRSVLSAYRRQICINFKDRGMQSFKTARFEEEQERIEDIFVSIPPPKPSNKRVEYSGMYGNSTPRQGHGRYSATPQAASVSHHPVASMRSYYNVSGGCFLGCSLVYLVNDLGITITDEVQRVKKGCKVLSHQGITRVEAVVELKYNGPIHQIGDNMKLTAFHPILINNIPSFPCEYSPVPVTTMFSGFVYDIILEDRGILRCPFNIGDTSDSDRIMFVATIGHCVQLPKFAHDYFGSEKIVQDLKKHDKWQDGHIKIVNPRYERNDNQEVVKIIL